MTYELEFDPRAMREWKKLGHTLQLQFKKKLAKVLENPHIEPNKLAGLPDCYKIKLRTSGYRLVYQIQHDIIVVFILAVGKRENSQVYDTAHQRITDH